MNFLETSRVRLESFRPDEWTLFLELDSDPEVMRFLSDGRPSSVSEVQETMVRVQALHLKWAHKYGVWKATETSSREFMGWFILRPDKLDPENEASLELGYRLKKKYWGKGLATEVSRALIERSFHDYKAREVWAKTTVTNFGSQKVMQKLGMKFIKNFMEDDKELVFYSLQNPNL